MQRPFVKTLLATTVLAAALLEGAAVAGELPTFEVSSFPATPLQVSVMGSAGVREHATTPSLTRNAMPASPHQIGVLTPRHHTVSSVGEATVGAARSN